MQESHWAIPLDCLSPVWELLLHPGEEWCCQVCSEGDFDNRVVFASQETSGEFCTEQPDGQIKALWNHFIRPKFALSLAPQASATGVICVRSTGSSSCLNFEQRTFIQSCYSCDLGEVWTGGLANCFGLCFGQWKMDWTLPPFVGPVQYEHGEAKNSAEYVLSWLTWVLEPQKEKREGDEIGVMKCHVKYQTRLLSTWRSNNSALLLCWVSIGFRQRICLPTCISVVIYLPSYYLHGIYNFSWIDHSSSSSSSWSVWWCKDMSIRRWGANPGWAPVHPCNRELSSIRISF